MEKSRCKQCGLEIENNVIYQCVRCFTEYCIRCEGSKEGKICPKCGMGARLILQPTLEGKRS
jgi:hypothetical protein